MSDALKLADALDTTGRPGGLCMNAAAELRRLHDEVESLRAEKAELLAALKNVVARFQFYRVYGIADEVETLNRAIAVIAKVEGA